MPAQIFCHYETLSSTKHIQRLRPSNYGTLPDSLRSRSIERNIFEEVLKKEKLTSKSLEMQLSKFRDELLKIKNDENKYITS